MGFLLTDIAQQLKDNNKKVQLIYAFNGIGKTRLSREFKLLMEGIVGGETELEELEEVSKTVLYYNAFTEDLFYWDNDLEFNDKPKLEIHPNSFTKWIFEEQGQDMNIISNFQHYTNEKLTPHFNEGHTEITFSYERGNDEHSNNIKISKGEESNFVWCVFYSLLEQVMDVLNISEPSNRETDQFDKLEYVFIDDPVSSLDDNHVIQLAVELAQLIKKNESDLRFIITTHNPLFYNVLYNEFNRDDKVRYSYYKAKKFGKYKLEKLDDGTFLLDKLSNDSPFSYHLFLKREIETAIETGKLKKYHFNFIRNILEKTSTFLGYKNWAELLPPEADGLPNPYEARILNISSHSKHSGEEIAELSDDDKRVIAFLLKDINKEKKFQFK